MEKEDLLKYSAIIGGGGVAVWALIRAAKFKDSADKLTVNISRFDVDIKGTEYLKFLLDIEFVNPSAQIISVSIPSIKPYYNGNELGYSVPMKDAKAINPKSITKISNVEIRVPISNLITAGLMTDVISSLKNLSALVDTLKQKTTFKIFAVVNGLEVSIEQKFGEEAKELGYIDETGGMFEGLGLVAAGKRNIKSGDQYDHLILKPDGTNDVVQNDGSVEDTVLWCGWVVKQYCKDTEQLAEYLKNKSKDDKTLYKNIFDFCYRHIQYHLDRKGIEQLRRPAATWRDRKTGVDCDDYTIFVASILYNLGKPFEFRIAKYSKPNYQHIYLIVPMKNNEHITIDPVLDTFNYEKPYSHKKDFDMKQLNLAGTEENLGIPIEILAGNTPDDDLLKVIFGEDLQDTINGLGSPEDDSAAMLKYLKRLRNVYVKNPDYIKDIQDPHQAVGMLDYAIKHWNNPAARTKALEILAQKEEELIDKGEIVLSGIDDGDEDWEEDTGYTGVEPELAGYEYKYDYSNSDQDDWEEDISFTGAEPEEPGYEYRYENPEWEEDFGFTGDEPEDNEYEYDYSVDGLAGKRRRRKKQKKSKKRVKRKARKKAKQANRRAKRKKKGGVFKRLASGAKKGFKTVAKGVMKVGAAPARVAFLTALRTNVGKISDKLKYAYLTEQQAVSRGIDRNEYRKLKSVHGKVENIFKKLGGNSKALRNAILSGKRKNLRGFEELNGELKGIDELDGFELDLGFTGNEPEHPEYEYKYDDQVWEADPNFTGVEPEDEAFVYDYSFNGLQGRALRFKKRKNKKTRYRRSKNKRRQKTNPTQANKLLAKINLWLKDINLKKVRTTTDKKREKTAFLKSLSNNHRNISTMLAYGYASEQKAAGEGVDKNTWNKIRTALSNTIQLYKKEFNGNGNELRKAILLGQNKPAMSGLGAVAALATAGSVAGIIGKIADWLKDIKLKRTAKKQAKQQFMESGGSKSDWKASGKKEFNQQWTSQKSEQMPTQEETITTQADTDFSSLITNQLKNSSANNLTTKSFTVPVNSDSNIVPVNYASAGQTNVKENAIKAFLKTHKKKLLIGGGLLGLGALAYVMLKPKKKTPTPQKTAISGTKPETKKKRKTTPRSASKKIMEVKLK